MLEIILIIVVISLILSSYTALQARPVSIKHKNAILLDTSALIDGRILEVVKTGFVPSQLLVPRFVIAELQLLADKADHMKRERARFGLSVIQELQASRDVDIAIIADDISSETGVDEKLVKLALKRNALLFTTDFNLLKVAEIEGVRVLNINELAQQLRPSRLPGEQAEIQIVQKGQERTQGIGYLDDGTLVVVEKAGTKISKTVTIEFTRNLQTSAGRMMFAKLVTQNTTPQAASANDLPRPGTKATATAKKTQSVSKRSNTTRSKPRSKPARFNNAKERIEESLLETIASQDT